MIKANELRLGNYVEYHISDSMDERKQWWELDKIEGSDIQWLTENPDDQDYRPIPLTEEWLIEKMKFHKQNNQIYSIGLKLFISWWNTNSIEIDINGEVLIINCKYVHELQNIYFALTGEELELKLN